jgi:hypothetical protein
MKQILLITLGLSTALFASFSKNGNIVTDSITALQWQDNAISSEMTWTQATDHCENLNLDGHSDWRLPNIIELTSIVDDSRVSPSIDTSIFKNTAAFEHTAVFRNYWSSTTYAGDSKYSWLVDFDSGRQFYELKRESFYVRCVRAGE